MVVQHIHVEVVYLELVITQDLFTIEGADDTFYIFNGTYYRLNQVVNSSNQILIYWGGIQQWITHSWNIPFL